MPLFFLTTFSLQWDTKNQENLEKCLPKGHFLPLLKKRLKFHQFSNPPEPSKWGWRLHKTSIFTFWPCPKNGIKSTSQNLTFWHPWAPKPPQVRKMRAHENTPKNTSAKIPKKCQNDLQNRWVFDPETPMFSSLGSDPSQGDPRTSQIPHFSCQNVSATRVRTSLQQTLHFPILKKRP